jgi:hypothetical protein
MPCPRGIARVMHAPEPLALVGVVAAMIGQVATSELRDSTRCAALITDRGGGSLAATIDRSSFSPAGSGASWLVAGEASGWPV